MNPAGTTATITRRGVVAATAVVLAVIAAWAAARTVQLITGSHRSDYTILFLVTFALYAGQQLLAFAERPHAVTAAQAERLSHLRVLVSIPCYNEDTAALRECIRSLLLQSRLPQTIHVVDDGSTAVTYEAVSQWAHEAASLAGVELVWTRQANGGKRRAQAFTFAAHPEADVFVTCDSDGIFDSRALEELLKPLADRSVTSVAGVVMAINNRTNVLARVTDLMYVGVQLTSRSALSTAGNVLVNSGPLAAYRADVIRPHLDGYLRETFMGRRVEFSDDSMLTLYARLAGRTVQQPTAMVFCLMPDRVGHHLRQYLRWMRGSTIRSIWRVRYLPVNSFGWWANVTVWAQLALGLIIFGALVIAEPAIHANWSVVPWMLAVSVSLGYLQTMRYLTITRSDESTWSRLGTWALSPLATLWALLVLRWVRLYGMATCAKTGWGTRQTVEVTLDRAA